MKKTLKAIMFLLLVSTSLIFVYCHEDFENEEGQQVPKKMLVDKDCSGKKILRFSSLAELQQKHYNLYQQYNAGNQEEQILVNYENGINFYSLRKKEEDMDAGIIPNDPAFEETNFTLDPILETLLNEDGMLVIKDRLYIWDSGCVIYSIPYNCKNYFKLLDFYNAARSGSTAAMHSIFVGNKMKNHNICDDKNFDFESISENKGKVEAGEGPREKNKNNCGYEVVANSKLASCDNNFYTFRVSCAKQIPPSTPSLDLFYIKPVVGSSTDIQISTGLNGTYQSISNLDQDIDYGYIVNFAPGTPDPHFYMRIPVATPTTFCDITFLSTIGSLFGGSCMASNTISVDNQCPFNIVAIQDFVNETQSKWAYSIEGPPGCDFLASKITWNFGDGTSESGNLFSTSHIYSVPCEMQYITVTATVDGTVCNTPGKTFIKQGIPYGNPCTRANYTFDPNDNNEQINGKKVKVRARISRTPLGRSKFVDVFKCRALGDKQINSIGAIYEPSATNGSCIEANIANVVPQAQGSGKKRLRRVKKSSNLYNINAINPYNVQFTHSSGFSYTLLPSGLYCSQ